MKRATYLVTILAIFVTISGAWGSVPGLISYQGMISDSEGNPITDTLNLTFTIYDDSLLSNPENITWQETHLNVGIINGLFQVIFGRGTPEVPITYEAFTGADRWLGIMIQGSPEQSPRTRLTSDPYSDRVGTIDGAAGGTVEGDLIVNGKASIGVNVTNTGLNAFAVGENVSATGDHSAVAGGINNTASGADANIGGGRQNTASGQAAVIAGGYAGTASNENSTIGGGWHNVASGVVSTVGGGQEDTASGTYSTISGGLENVSSGFSSVVSGGNRNIASGTSSVVGGGADNEASAYYSTEGGGNLNVASSYGSTVSGGVGNQGSGDYSSIMGGASNTASGDCSAIPGGRDNSAAGNYSMAAGRRAKALHSGSFVWADSTNSDFASTGGNQFIVRASGGVGINTNTPTAALDVNGEAKCVVGGVDFFMVPRGAIIMWSGALASIPAGWALCDGTNGTPNLRDRFIMACQPGENPGGTGGASSHFHTVDIAPFASGTPSHYWLAASGGISNLPDYNHYHTVNPPPTDTNSKDNIPPYYKLAFIMKL